MPKSRPSRHAADRWKVALQAKHLGVNVLVWLNLDHRRAVIGSNVRFRLRFAHLVVPRSVSRKPRPSMRWRRVTAQHHHQDQPPDRPLAVGVGADELGHVPDRRRLGLRAAGPWRPRWRVLS